MSTTTAGADGPMQQQTGQKAVPLYVRDYNATSSPPFFHQWKQVITRYPFTSLMGFSALLRCAVMEQPLMKIHMAGCLKIISQSHSPRPFLGHFPITENLENQSEFSVLHAKEVLIILENML